MTADPVRQLAQTNPLPNLSAQWTDSVGSARRFIELLTLDLRQIDKLTESLAEHGITLNADLGPIGNAAAAARRDLEKQKPARTFELPR